MDSLTHIFDEVNDDLPPVTLDGLRAILDRLDNYTDAEKDDRGFVPDQLNACLDDLTAWYRAALRAEGTPLVRPASNSLAASLDNLYPSLTDRRPA